MTYEAMLKWIIEEERIKLDEAITRRELNRLIGEAENIIDGATNRTGKQKDKTKINLGRAIEDTDTSYNVGEMTDSASSVLDRIREAREIYELDGISVAGLNSERVSILEEKRENRRKFIEERLLPRRREFGIEYVERTSIEELQKSTRGALRARELTEEEIRMIESGEKPF